MLQCLFATHWHHLAVFGRADKRSSSVKLACRIAIEAQPIVTAIKQCRDATGAKEGRKDRSKGRKKEGRTAGGGD